MRPHVFGKFSLQVFLMVWLIGSVHAQQSSLLWKVSGNGLEKESYLFGTIHLICKEDFRMDQRILDAFGNSEKLVMELDMGDPELQAKMQQISMNPGMKNIQSELDSADAAFLDGFFVENFGVGLAQLGVLKPVVLSSMALMKSIPCQEIESYELFLTAQATESKKPIIGLETPEFQIGVFDQIPQETQIQELVKMLKEDAGPPDFQKMTETYLSEDVDGIYEVMNSEGMMKDYRELVLDSRNRAWVAKLNESMKDQSLFVAVGAGHLAGENGLIPLLRKAGYAVEPVAKP